MKLGPVVIFSLLLAGIGVQGQTVPPAIKGHSLGESLQEFVEKSTPETKARVAQCQTSSAPECQNIPKLLTESPDNRPEELYFPCKQKFYIVWCQEDMGAAYFEKDKLVEIDVRVFGSWDEQRETLIKKFGNPTGTRDQIEQNGYGATAHAVKGVWLNSTYEVVASEWVDSNFNRSVFVILETLQHARQKAERERQKHTGDLD